MLNFCHGIFESQSNLLPLNDTFLCLIPKFKNTNQLKNFRPIGLCNTIYKVITKIIANRIKPFLEKLIGPNKLDFLKGDDLVIMPSKLRKLFDICIKVKSLKEVFF